MLGNQLKHQLKQCLSHKYLIGT